MGMIQPFSGNAFDQLGLNLIDVLAGRHAGAVAEAEDMGIDAIVGWSNAMLRTTLAVLRPTPGSLTSSSRVCGISPPKSAISILHSAITFFALLRYRPMVLI